MEYLEAKAPEGPLSPDTLYSLWIGTNDYLYSIDDSSPNIGPRLVEEVLGNISLTVDLLIDHGATR